MPRISPICILEGVPPRMCPTFRSCNISPATADETHTTAVLQVRQRLRQFQKRQRDHSSAAITSVQSVESGNGIV